MFDNIGGKIKTLAVVTCGLGIIASIIGAFALWIQSSDYNPTAFSGVLVLVLGSLASWICSSFTYGFGELIENSETLHADNLKIQELLKTQKVESAGSTPVVHLCASRNLILQIQRQQLLMICGNVPNVE